MPLAHGTSQKTISSTQVAYLAGLFDGEGSISARFIKRSPHSINIQISITMCDRAPVALFAEVFGGRVRLENRLTRSGKPIYSCGYYCRRAADILEEMQPYLTVKADRARAAIAAARMTKARREQYRPLTDEEIEQRHALAARIRAANLGSNGRLAIHAA